MAEFYIAFDTKDMAPNILATKVTLSTEVIRDMNRPLAINLSEHPLYPALYRYVASNPPLRPKD